MKRKPILVFIMLCFAFMVITGAIVTTKQVFKSDLFIDGPWYIDNTEVTSTAAELNRVDGNFAVGTASYAFGTSDAQDDVDVSAVNALFLDSSTYAITIGGFTGGVDGQMLFITCTDSTETITIENEESTGNQDMYLDGAGDVTLNVNEGVTLLCDGSNWYEVHR